MRYLNCKRWKG